MRKMIRVLSAFVLASIGVACNHRSEPAGEQGSLSPTAPSVAPTMATSSRGDAAAVAFPPRNEPFDFRANALEAKYRDQLQRGAVSTFVDVEGTIVWTQEYLLYRVSGCGHEDAIQRVLRQIDGAPFQGACASGTFPFPPRNEPFDFRGRLEAKYRDGLRRSTVQTFVDVEGDIVWTQEYLRYRVSGCAHALSTQKVMDQIDGRGVQSDCAATPPPPPPPPPPSGCNYSVSPTSQTVVAGGEARTAAVTTTAGCTWTVTSDVTWLTIQSGSSNSGTGTIRYTAAANPGAERIGNIQVRWPTVTAGQNIRVTQQAATAVAANFLMTQNGLVTTDCNLGGLSANNCALDGSSSTGPGGIASYSWVITRLGSTVNAAGPQVSLAFGCVGGDLTNTARPLEVTLTVTANGGGQASLTRSFQLIRAVCGS